MLCSRLFKKMPKGGHGGGSKESRFFRPIDRVYTPDVAVVDGTPEIRRRSCASLWSLAIVPMFMVIGKNFVPEDDRGAFEVSIRAPEGTSLTLLDQYRDAGRERYTDVAGCYRYIDERWRKRGSEQYGYLCEARRSRKDRQFSQAQLMGKTRELLERYASTLRTSVQQAGGLSAGARNAQIQYVLTGPDLDQLSKYSDVLLAKMKAIPDRRRRRYVVDNRQTRAPHRNRPEARRRSRCSCQRHRTGPQYHGGW